MTKSVLKKYAPLYISLAVTGLVMTLIFLNPGSALGLSVVVDTPENDRNGLSGFTLGEEVMIHAEVNLEGTEETLTSIALAITQTDGDSEFINFVLNLPAREGTFDITDQLPEDSTGNRQGSASVEVILEDVTVVLNNGYGYGYGYGYRGEQGGGTIKLSITYTPPSIVGDYTADLIVTTPTETVQFSVDFSVLGPRAGTSTVLTTLYPRTEDSTALPGDLVVIQLQVNGNADDIAVNDIGFPEVYVFEILQLDIFPFGIFVFDEFIPMLEASKYHKSLRDKWGVDPDADFLAAITIDSSAVPGNFNPEIVLEDIAGQFDEVETNVVIADTRDSFNVYVQPGFNFVTPALQCSADSPPCIGSFEFDIDALLGQPVSNGANGIGTLSDVVEIIWGYCAFDTEASTCPTSSGGTPSFVSFVPDRSVNDLDSLVAGNGYILKAKADAFQTNQCTSPCQLDGDDVPSPIKVTFNGQVNADPNAVPSSTSVEPIWNLVGPHSETDTTVGAYLQAVTFPLRDWEQVIAVQNLLDVSLDYFGNTRVLPSGFPEVVFISQKFQTLGGPPIEYPGDTIPAGSGLWLFMDEEGDGGELPAILSD